MTQRKDDHTPPPPGGRAAERLRQFEEARGIRKRQEELENPEDPGQKAPGSQDPSDEPDEKKSGK